jgi:hypothetical protein
VSGDVLTADAAGDITIRSNVVSADISSSGAGDIFLTESNEITLTDVDTADGSINVTALQGNLVASDVKTTGVGAIGLTATAGNLTAQDVATANGAISGTASGTITAVNVDSSGTDNNTNDISLTAGADILVSGTVKAAEDITGLNDVSLNAGTEITDGGTGSGVSGDVLTADAAGDILIRSNVVSADISSTVAGDIRLTESNSVNIQVTAQDNITITDGGTLQTGAITSLAGGNINLNATATLDVNDLISTNASGNIDLTGAGITLGGGAVTAVAGDVSVHSPVVLDLTDTQRATTITSNSGDVTFDSTIDGIGQNLLVNNGGRTSFLGSIGTSGKLESIETDLPGTVRIVAQEISTTGSQTYRELVELDDSIALNGNNISFNTDGGELSFADLRITDGDGNVGQNVTSSISFNSNGGDISLGSVNIEDEVRVIFNSAGNTNAGDISFTKITAQDVTDPNALLDDPTIDPDLFEEYVQLLAGDSANIATAGSVTGEVDVYDLKVTGGSGVLTGQVRESLADTIGRDAAESIDTDYFLMPSVMTFNGFRVTGGPSGNLNDKLFLRFDDKIQAGQNEDLFAGSIRNGVISDFITIKDAKAKGDKWSVLGVGKGFPEGLFEPKTKKKEAKSITEAEKPIVDEQASRLESNENRTTLSGILNSFLSVFRG